jgi:hypothetical protein
MRLANRYFRSCADDVGTDAREGNVPLQLSAPKVSTFSIPIIIAVIAVVIHYAHIEMPERWMHIRHVQSRFVILLVGYLVLVAGNVLRGV